MWCRDPFRTSLYTYEKGIFPHAGDEMYSTLKRSEKKKEEKKLVVCTKI